MQVPRDILLNCWTWLMILTPGPLCQYASSQHHQSARFTATAAATAQAEYVLQALERRLSDISEVISGRDSPGMAS